MPTSSAYRVGQVVRPGGGVALGGADRLAPRGEDGEQLVGVVAEGVEGRLHLAVRLVLDRLPHVAASVPVNAPSAETSTTRRAPSGDAADPSFAYSLGPGQTQSVPDLLPAIGISGFGSVDVMSSAGPAPVVLVRLFNDAGAAGTQGSTEEVVRPQDALAEGDSGVLVGPADTVLFRFNIGVRSLDAGA